MSKSTRLYLSAVVLVGIGCLLPTSALAKTFVLPHVLETKGAVDIQEAAAALLIPHLQDLSGKNAKSEFNADFSILAINTGGLGGVPSLGDAEVAIFLFDDATGLPLEGVNGPICPTGCRFLLAPGKKVRSTVEQLANANAGGLKGAGVTLGYGIITITGAGTDAVNLSAIIVNTHTGAFDVSVFGFAPMEIQGAP